MLDRFDAAFRGELEREIRKRLEGDSKEVGLYKQILGANDWDTFVRTKGVIHGYEQVQELMRDIAKRLNENWDKR